MSTGTPVDVQELHELLWERADRLGRLKIKQEDLAKDLDLRFETISRAFSKMTNQGRIKRLKSDKGNIGTYLIRDPKGFLEALEPRG